MVRVAVVMGKIHAKGKNNLKIGDYRHIDRRSKLQLDFFCDIDSNLVPKEKIELLGSQVYIFPPWASYYLMERMMA